MRTDPVIRSSVTLKSYRKTNQREPALFADVCLYPVHPFGWSRSGLESAAAAVILLMAIRRRMHGKCCGSDLLDGLSWNQPSLLPAAELQKHLTVFSLPHTDLREMKGTRMCNCWEGHVSCVPG